MLLGVTGGVALDDGVPGGVCEGDGVLEMLAPTDHEADAVDVAEPVRVGVGDAGGVGQGPPDGA